MNALFNQEFLLVNKSGGFSSSTFAHYNTRKYHGLLIVNLPQKNLKYNILSKLELSVIIDKKEYFLSTNKFSDAISPEGYKYIESANADILPEIIYNIEGYKIKVSVCMPEFSNKIIVKYDLLEGKKSVKFKLIPLLSYRNIHSLMRENMDIQKRSYVINNGIKIEPYNNLPPLFFRLSSVHTFYHSPVWWNNFQYDLEKERGYEYTEDLFSPGIFETILKPGNSFFLSASTSDDKEKIKKTWNTTLNELSKNSKSFKNNDLILNHLLASADKYLIKTDTGWGINAGYPWFDEWGRDTFISFAGITLVPGKFDLALGILKRYVKYVHNGLIPNIINNNITVYNSIDASLLFFRAVQQYLYYTKDRKSIENFLLLPMIGIIDYIRSNKSAEFYINENGILFAGTERTNLTWMDAMVDGIPVTARHGAAIEINALWFNAISFIADEFKDHLNNDLILFLKKTIQNFIENNYKLFLNEKTAALKDVYNPKSSDDFSIRPNQLYALGLDYRFISDDLAIQILKTVKEKLVTPYGLRTLDPDDKLYHKVYRGNQKNRDQAYHQGTVWPYLIGIYFDAMDKNIKNKNEIKNEIIDSFSKLWNEHITQKGIAHISEIFDADEPHFSNGCIAQAWSTAEVIRVLDRCSSF